MRFLVVDDDPVFRAEFCDVLDGEGHATEGAASTLDAVARLSPGAFDAVFTDLRMPRFSGLDLLKEVRRRAPSTHAILVTGQADEATALEALRAGALDVLGKPFDFATLQRSLDALEEQRAYRDRIAPRQTLDAARGAVELGPDQVALLATGEPPEGWAHPLPLSATNPWAAIAAARGFAEGRASAAVVVRVDRSLLGGIGPSPTIAFVGQLRSGLPPTCRAIVGVEGPWLADDVMMSLRATLGLHPLPSSLAPAVLPGLRHLVAELAGGRGPPMELDGAPTSEGARRRARLLHRLTDVGWMTTSGPEGVLSEEGRRAAQALAELETRGDRTESGDRTFTLDPGRGVAPAPPR